MMASTLYCPYCNAEKTGRDYDTAKVKVRAHIRNACKKKPVPA